MAFPDDYVERVYAGVLGKIIGVYLGRPFEGWGNEHIEKELGEIWYYVHEKRGTPLIVTDDDISGTFTFLRALPDYEFSPDLTPEQIGATWLNYLIEGRTILWWGGLGNSTEHTAYLRLKKGIRAPESGSIALNSKVVAEQIGSQIFIDGWGLIFPNEPAKAADFARRAASVSHDGEAIYGAQVVAALVAAAFGESDIHRLLDIAVAQIPRDSVIARMITDLRAWNKDNPNDWRAAFHNLAAHYGYDKYGGNCHMVPNHGLIILALLWGGGDFQKSLMIGNTCGWDTDCNSGNIGCILGVRNGLAGIDNGPDWRGPVADRLYLPTADGGRAITDAVRETYEIVNTARALQNVPPLTPKDGARFHFSLPGSVQGWITDDRSDSRGVLTGIENKGGKLALNYRHLGPGRSARAYTATFLPPDALNMPGYTLLSSPTLYPGQAVRATVQADAANAQSVTCRLYLEHYTGKDDLSGPVFGPEVVLSPGASQELTWNIPETGGQPIARLGIALSSDTPVEGTVFVDRVTWEGMPHVTFDKPQDGGQVWRRAWINGVHHFEGWSDTYRLMQNEGIGLVIQGTREWTDYTVSATAAPHMVRSAGIAARVQGMNRYYALLLTEGGRLRLVKRRGYEEKVLAETGCAWEFGLSYDLTLTVSGSTIRGAVRGMGSVEATDTEHPLTGGSVAMVCEEGRVAFGPVTVGPSEAK